MAPVGVPETEKERTLSILAGAVDADFYRFVYGDVALAGIEPLCHYVDTGWREGRDPNPWFSTEAYLTQNQDVDEADINPLLHFVMQGFYEGRSAYPSQSAEAFFRCESNAFPQPVAPMPIGVRDAAKTRVEAGESEPGDDNDPVVQLVGTAIDGDHYRSQLSSLGLGLGGMTPAEHYVKSGAAMGLDPVEWFSTQHYEGSNADVVAAKINPLYHYLVAGKEEGRTPQKASGDAQNESAVIAAEFDAEYYCATYPDIEQSGCDPLMHFVVTGWHEGRDPNPYFSTKDYLELYGDVAQAGLNPFYHYLIAGRQEGRKPKAELGFRYNIISNNKTFDEQLAEYHSFRPVVEPANGHSLEKAMRGKTRCANRMLHVSVSHDNYAENIGGVQLCLRREADAFALLSYDHLHIFPTTPFPTVRDDRDPILGVLFNGEKLGFLKSSVIARSLKTVFGASGTKVAAVHSLLGHNGDAVSALLAAVGVQNLFFWIHDYASVCANYNLLRNDVEFCGAPSPNSAACRICKYGAHRARQASAHQILLDNFKTTIVAPSQAALDIWSRAFDASRWETRVSPHCTLTRRTPATDARSIFNSVVARAKPLRVAYLGIPANLKGWPAFRELALAFAKDKRYEFFHLGVQKQRGLPITFREVVVSSGDRNAMVDAIEDCAIDVAIIWSLTPETFCFTAHEALAAGAFLIGHCDSGNASVLAAKNGVVYESEDQLFSSFERGEIIELTRIRPRGKFDIHYSPMTAAFLGGISNESFVL